MKTKIKNNFLTASGIICFLIFSASCLAQDSAAVKKDTRPVKSQFESGYLIDNQTVKVNSPGTLEFVMQHRFGTINSETFDLAGIYGNANIRLGLNYTILKNLQIGLGTTKINKLQDANIKWAFLKQTRSGNIPLSATLYADAAYDVREQVYDEQKTVARLSYFSQLIIARSFGKRLSVQVAPSFTHFNIVDSLVKHNNIGISVNGRYKFSAQSAIIFGYDQNLTSQDETVIDPKPNISFGIEIATSSHAFQIFMGNYNYIIPQHNMLYNANDFTKGEFLIGFNITRLWNFSKG